MSDASYFSDAGVFLIKTAFGFYIFVVLLRFLLQWARADFYNPLVQFLVRLTTPVLRPLRRLIPGYAGLDWAAVVLMLVLKCIEIALIGAVWGALPGLPGLPLLAITELLALTLNVLFWAVFIAVILSWVNPDPYHPAVTLIWQLTEPLLQPARRWVPPVAGFDLSPILVLVVLQLGQMLLVAPLRDLSFALMAPGPVQ
jgi:YggT family protein